MIELPKVDEEERMEKTMKQIADDLGVSKQRVYRHIKKNHINEAHQENGVMYYDEAVQEQIKQAFAENEAYREAHHEAHHEAHQKHINDTVNEALLKQLEEKDRQIAELMKLLDQSQQLQAISEQKILLLEEQAAGNGHDKKPWWKFW